MSIEIQPMQFWATVIPTFIGGTVGLLVAWITNHRADRREERRVQFEREQKDIERKLQALQY